MSGYKEFHHCCCFASHYLSLGNCAETGLPQAYFCVVDFAIEVNNCPYCGVKLPSTIPAEDRSSWITRSEYERRILCREGMHALPPHYQRPASLPPK